MKRRPTRKQAYLALLKGLAAPLVACGSWGVAAMFCLVFTFHSGAALAHNPVSSWTVARLWPDRLELRLEMAAESGWLVLGGQADSPPDVAGHLPQLKAAAPDVYTISVGGKALVPRESNAVFSDEDGSVVFRAIFPRPLSSQVRFDARYLTRLPADHRATLTVKDETGKSVRSELVNPAKTVVDLELPGEATSRGPAKPTVSFLSFLKLGIEHILTGYDHLLFLLGLLVVCRRFSTTLTIVTCFTVAHSLTLALAALNVVTIPSRVVEPLIAASIAFVGVENLLRRGEPKGRWLLTFAFGLIHGFGFASVLREAGVGAGGKSLVLPLFSFNLGVELGQLAVVAVLLPLLWKLRSRRVFDRYGVSVISVVVVLLGGYWLLQRTIFA
jgi:hydrogenase/urease accessory protein HupE